MGCGASKARGRDILENHRNLPIQYAANDNGYGGSAGNYNIRVPRRSISMPAANDATRQGYNTDINIVSLPAAYSYGINLDQKESAAVQSTPSISEMLKVLQSLDMGPANNDGEDMDSPNLKQGRRVSIVDDLRPGLERQLSEAMVMQRSRELQQASASPILQSYDNDKNGSVDVSKYIHAVNQKDEVSQRNHGYGGVVKQKRTGFNVLSSKSMPLSSGRRKIPQAGYDSAKLDANYGATQVDSAKYEADVIDSPAKIDNSANYDAAKVNYANNESSANYDAVSINNSSTKVSSANDVADKIISAASKIFNTDEYYNGNHVSDNINYVKEVNSPNYANTNVVYPAKPAPAKLVSPVNPDFNYAANHADTAVNGNPVTTFAEAPPSLQSTVMNKTSKQQSKSGKLSRWFKRSSVNSNNNQSKPLPVENVAEGDANPKQYTDADLVSLVKESGQAEGLKNAIASNGEGTAPVTVQEHEEDPLERFEPLCPPGGEKSLVLYTTSLRGIRKTFDHCNSVRGILKSLRLKIDERDVAMDPGFREELKQLIAKSVMATYNNSNGTSVPRLFINGRYIGGGEDILRLHEEGELGRLLRGIAPNDASNIKSFGQPCDGCGDARFLPCFQCNGSTKVFLRPQSSPTRCPDCNENGLIQCPICS